MGDPSDRGEDVPSLEDVLADAMQHLWDDWCADTGCIPDGFRIAGPPSTRVYADFRSGPFPARLAEMVRAYGKVEDAEDVLLEDVVNQAYRMAQDAIRGFGVARREVMKGNPFPLDVAHVAGHNLGAAIGAYNSALRLMGWKFDGITKQWSAPVVGRNAEDGL